MYRQNQLATALRALVSLCVLTLIGWPLQGLGAQQTIRALYDAGCQAIELPDDSELSDFQALRRVYSLESYAGRPIGRIKIYNLPVFDLTNPDENSGFTRLVNRIHFPTRHYVIRRQILFAEGEALDAREITESERILRSNSFLSDAAVLPLQQCGDNLDLVIVVRDLWTMMPKFYISRTGGFTKYGLALEDNNFLGTGNALTLLYENDRERDTSGIGFATRNLFGSRIALTSSYADASDGYTRRLNVEQPFYALDTSLSYGIHLNENSLEESLQALNQTLAVFEHDNTDYDIFAGFSPGLIDGFTRRYVVGYSRSEDLFKTLPGVATPPGTIPADRRLAYPWFRFSVTEDDYAVYRNLNDIHRTEDVSVGLQFSSLIGYAGDSVGSDLARWIFSLSYSDSPLVAERHLLRTRVSVTGQRDRRSDRLVSTLSRVGLNYFALLNAKQRFYVGLLHEQGQNLAIDELLVLGGDEGLRGYPSEFLLGDNRSLVNLEFRHFFDAHFLNVFRFAGVIFFDAGRTDGESVTSIANGEWLKSTGLGLRMNSSKTNISKIVHVDIAFPLDQRDLVGDYEVRVFGSTSF